MTLLNCRTHLHARDLCCAHPMSHPSSHLRECLTSALCSKTIAYAASIMSLNLRSFMIVRAQGLPVLWFWGLSGHRYLALLQHEAALACRLRILCVDRPGQGGSTPPPAGGMRVLDWPGTRGIWCSAGTGLARPLDP
jgi:hypothetical protein